MLLQVSWSTESSIYVEGYELSKGVLSGRFALRDWQV